MRSPSLICIDNLELLCPIYNPEKDSNSNGNQEIDATEHESEIVTDGSNENLPEMSQSQINRRPKKTKINDFVVTSSTTINDNQKRDSLINDYRQIFNEDRITYLLRFPSLLQTYNEFF